MTQEEKELLLKLLEKANEDNSLQLKDRDGNYYYPSWMFIDNGKIFIELTAS